MGIQFGVERLQKPSVADDGKTKQPYGGGGGDPWTAIGGIGVGVADLVLDYKARKENLKWLKESQREQWRREDNAHSREVYDLRMAGLSPTLSAGGGANAGDIVKTDPVTMDSEQLQQGLLASEMISKTRAEKAWIEQQIYNSQQMLPRQIESIESQTNRLNAMVPSEIQQMTAAASHAFEQAATLNWNLERSREAGVVTNPSLVGGTARDTTNMIMKTKRDMMNDPLFNPNLKTPNQIVPKGGIPQINNPPLYQNPSWRNDRPLITQPKYVNPSDKIRRK